MWAISYHLSSTCGGNSFDWRLQKVSFPKMYQLFSQLGYGHLSYLGRYQWSRNRSRLSVSYPALVLSLCYWVSSRWMCGQYREEFLGCLEVKCTLRKHGLAPCTWGFLYTCQGSVHTSSWYNNRRISILPSSWEWAHRTASELENLIMILYPYLDKLFSFLRLF